MIVNGDRFSVDEFVSLKICFANDLDRQSPAAQQVRGLSKLEGNKQYKLGNEDEL